MKKKYLSSLAKAKSNFTLILFSLLCFFTNHEAWIVFLVSLYYTQKEFHLSPKIT